MAGTALIHSMGLTPRHVILVECPYRLEMLHPHSPKKGGIADYARFVDGDPVVAHVIDRATGNVTSIRGPAGPHPIARPRRAARRAAGRSESPSRSPAPTVCRPPDRQAPDAEGPRRAHQSKRETGVRKRIEKRITIHR